MPSFYRITGDQLNKVQSVIAKKDELIERMKLKERAARGMSQAKTVGEIVGTALVVGAVRGKCEAAYGHFNVPGLEFDAELALGMLLTGAGFVMAQTKGEAKKYADDVLTVGATVLGGFARGVARTWGQTGSVSLSEVSGGLLGEGSKIAGLIGAGGGGWQHYQPAAPATVLDAMAKRL